MCKECALESIIANFKKLYQFDISDLSLIEVEQVASSSYKELKRLGINVNDHRTQVEALFFTSFYDYLGKNKRVDHPSRGEIL